ncbi:MAG: hypothetical protein ACLP0B_08930 [Steroidobacteraceae bacterium]
MRDIAFPTEMKIIDAPDLVAPLQQAVTKVAANEARSACHQNSHSQRTSPIEKNAAQGLPARDPHNAANCQITNKLILQNTSLANGWSHDKAHRYRTIAICNRRWTPQNQW